MRRWPKLFGCLRLLLRVAYDRDDRNPFVDALIFQQLFLVPTHHNHL